MPLGIVTNEEFEAELARCQFVYRPKPEEKQEPEKPEHDTCIGHGRNVGDTNIPPVVRKIIGEAAVDSRQAALAVAAALGVSSSSASAYAVGAHSTSSYHQPDTQLATQLDKARTEVITRSRDKLLTALDYITASKLADASVRDVSGVAKDMAQIIAHQEPRLILANQQTIGAQFVFHVPESRGEQEFEVLDIGVAAEDADVK